jgi:peptidyl-prolyl cis-trans isomerase C
MTKRLLTILPLALAAALHAQDAAPKKAKAAATPDLNKLAASASSKSGSSSSSVALKDPVAVVNGEKISKADLEKAFNEALTASGANAATLTADQKLQGYSQILKGMIMEKLVNKQAASITVDKADVDAQIAKIKSQFPSEQVFSDEMKKAGVTAEQFAANIEKSLRQSKWMQAQVEGKDAVTEDEAKKFYDEHTKEFANPDLVKASHILFCTPENATPDQVKAAENKAKAAIVRANKGEDFAKLAGELSEEPGAAQRGGDLGYFPKERMVPEFSEAAFAQKVNTVSATPVKTKFGFHVIKVTDKKPAGTASFDEVKENLLKFLKSQKDRQIMQATMKDLEQSAKIENTLPAPAAAPAPVK